MREAAFDKRLVEQGSVEKGQRVLDLGCGIASLAILIKKAQPGAEVIGIDGDRKVLEIARGNAHKQNAGISLFDAMVFDIPCRDNYFDRVFSSMLFHHHETKEKIRTAKEIYRILKPGGELHIADFGKPQNALMTLIARIMRNVEGVVDNIQGLLPHIIYAADFFTLARPWYALASQPRRFVVHPQDKGAGRELEQEIRFQREFSLSEAIAREAKGTFKGVSAVPALDQARHQVAQFIHANLRDSSGALRRQLEFLVQEHDSLLGQHLANPLEALRIELAGILEHEAALLEFVRQVDQRYGEMFLERPRFQRPGEAPHPDDEYTHESVRAALCE